MTILKVQEFLLGIMVHFTKANGKEEKWKDREKFVQLKENVLKEFGLKVSIFNNNKFNHKIYKVH